MEDDKKRRPGLYDRITAARKVLGVREKATLGEIKKRTRALLKQWHPDHGNADKATCEAETLKILEASQLIEAYCDVYRLSFSREEVEKYLPPDEWWLKRFGDAPNWDLEQLK